MNEFQYRYKTVYLTDEELAKLAKEKGNYVSNKIKELMKDGWKYRERIADGDYIKK